MGITSTLFKIGCIFGIALLVSGCVTTDVVKSVDANVSVRRVDYSKAPELKALAEHAMRFGNEMYPKVCALFAVEGVKPPHQFDIVFCPIDPGRIGETFVERRRISMNSMHLTNMPDGGQVFEKVLVHEMTHMALRHDTLRWSKPQEQWEEGLADYAYFKLVSTNGWGCPQCDYRFPHYTSGYTCASAFLLYVESRFGSNVIQELTSELCQGRYSDKFFVKTTGVNLEALWADFQKTSAFKPGATVAFALQQALGITEVHPPKSATRRFNKYLEAHADAFTRQAFKSARLDDKSMKDVRTQMAVYLYFSQPGGSAEKAWMDLREQGKVPGIVKGEKGSLSAFLPYDEIASQNYPMSRTLEVRKQGDDSIYHYTMIRVGLESDWKLTKGWRTGNDSKVIEEFTVP